MDIYTGKQKQMTRSFQIVSMEIFTIDEKNKALGCDMILHLKNNSIL